MWACLGDIILLTAGKNLYKFLRSQRNQLRAQQIEVTKGPQVCEVGFPGRAKCPTPPSVGSAFCSGPMAPPSGHSFKTPSQMAVNGEDDKECLHIKVWIVRFPLPWHFQFLRWVFLQPFSVTENKWFVHLSILLWGLLCFALFCFHKRDLQRQQLLAGGLNNASTRSLQRLGVPS